MKKLTVCAVVFMIVGFFSAAYAYEAIVGPTGVLKYDKSKSYGGYTLISPMTGCKTSFLIDMEGNLIHKWETDYAPGLMAMLLPNGNLLRGTRHDKRNCTVGGAAGGVQEIDWNGKVVWEYMMNTPTEIQHHCFDRMPNGNTLILGWEFKSIEDAIAKGRDPKTIPVSIFSGGVWHYGFWVDFVREVDKAGRTVWEWHVWDHVGTGPNQFDINYKLPKPVGEIYATWDWTHFNTCEYVPEKDLILLNSRNFSEFYLVDHKTGEMVYRWGNPSAYGQGKAPSWYDNGDQKIFGNHNATWLGNDRVQVFDNGSERPEGNRSAVVEVDIRTGKIVWEFETKTSNSFYSYRQGAAQRLPNGNVHVTSTQQGHLFEVTPDKKVVWDYVNPVHNGKVKCTLEDGDSHHGSFNMIHRSYRYAADFPGLKGKDLSVKGPLAPQCPSFYRIYQEGAKVDVKAPAPVTKPAKPEDDDGPPAMKAY
ncbi:MAG: aryl-sulfate sulfotransferase [Deltaproteobacteria bacterium]|nr:aryl-sulfate sulfotransferase [Deltaproteobacteria bacterium]